MENLLCVLDAFLSPVEDIRIQASDFIEKQVYTNSIFFIQLFEIYSNSTELNHKKLSLIFIRYVIIDNFSVIEQNSEQFSELLRSAVLKTIDSNLLKSLSEIVYQITLKNKNIWPDFPQYITLFKQNINYIPFCFYLYESIFIDNKMQIVYEDILNELKFDILSNSFQFPDLDIQINSSRLFCSLTRNYKSLESFPIEYQNCCQFIYEIAQQSLTFNENNFDSFWSAILCLNSILSQPFYILSRTFLAQSNHIFSPHTKSILFQFVIRHSDFIQKEELGELIDSFFIVQCEVEDIDDTGVIFSNLSKIDIALTYELFKKNIFLCLTNQFIKIQWVGLVMLKDFFPFYPLESLDEVSAFIDCVLHVALNSIENVTASLYFFSNFFATNRLNFSDSMKVFDFFVTVIVNYPQSELQYAALQNSSELVSSSIFFDKLIDVFPHVQIQSIPLYLSSLLLFHTGENNLTKIKYEKFIDSVLSIFLESSQIINQISNNGTVVPEDEEVQLQLYSNILLRGSAANMIYFFSFYNPLKLNCFVDIVIQSFISMLFFEEELNKFENSRSFGMSNISDDFSNICLYTKAQSIELLRPYYDKIYNSIFYINFRALFIEADGIQCSLASDSIEEFEDKFKEIEGQSFDLDTFINDYVLFIPDFTKWLYKIPDECLHFKLLKYLVIGFNQAYYSTQLFESLCSTLLRLVKPKRIAFNQGNPWYLAFVTSVNKLAVIAVTLIIPKINPSIHRNVFPAFLSLMKLFILSKNQFGHQFLNQTVIPLYMANQGQYESVLLRIFNAMLNAKYYTDEEFVLMTNIVNEIIQKGSFYQNAQTDLFLVINSLSKLVPELAHNYIQIALNLFESSRNDFSQSEARCCYALFLFSLFNSNPEVYSVIIPLLPEIFGLFPISTKIVMKLFLNEIFIFIKNNSESLSKIIIEVILAALIRYVSYQMFAYLIFGLTSEQNDQIIKLFKDMLNSYCQKMKNINVEDFIQSIIPDQPHSIQYIISLLNTE